MHKALLSVLILFLLSIKLLAQDSTAVYIELLKKEDTRSHALERLCAGKDLSMLPLLAAIQEKKLYLENNQWITTGEENDKGEKKLYTVYPVLKAYAPQGKELFKKVSELTEKSFSRKDRLFILPHMPFINLASADVEKRKLAYSQFTGKKDKETLETLQQALNIETDEATKTIALEVIYSIQLYLAPQPEKIKYLDKLADNHGPNTLSILEDFIASGEGDETVNAHARDMLEKVESRVRWLGIAQNLFSGLSLGSILMLIALGLAIIYGLAGVINMAHGEFLMIGAYTTFFVQEVFFKMGLIGDAFFWFSLPCSFLVAGFLGFITERLILRKLYNRPMESLLATWGLSLVLIQLARTIFGDLTSVRAPSLLSGGWAIAPQLVLPYNRIFIIVFSVIMIMITYLYLFKTKSGLRIRSVTQNRNMSACLGIATDRVDSLTFFIGSGIAGISGCCMTLIGNVVPDMGQTYIVDSFLVVVTGGVGNLLGTILAGLGLGFMTKFLEPVFQAVYGKVILLAIVILFLQIKPRGLFPAKGRIADE